MVRYLFMKYVSDKYSGDPNAMIEVPAGGAFDDMVALEDDLRLQRALRVTSNIDFYRYQVSFQLFKG